MTLKNILNRMCAVMTGKEFTERTGESLYKTNKTITLVIGGINKTYPVVIDNYEK
jgi:hypothetical protein